MKVLIAIDYTGIEMGWLLMKWQAKLRYKAKNYDKVYVVTDPSMFPIYQDFAETIDKMSQDCSMFVKSFFRYNGVQVDYIWPTKEFCFDDDKYPQEFIRYGVESSDRKGITLHPRKKNDGREWSKFKWERYISELKEVTKMVIVPIGATGSAYKLQAANCRDAYIGIRLQTTINVLNNTKLIVGPSSGPMHLASLCGCPQLVWSDNKKWNLGGRKGTNRERYEHFWNPFNCKVNVVDSFGWNPPVDVILSKTKELLGC